MADREAVEKKLSSARTWLIIDKPFLGALVLRLPLVAGDSKWCRTTATDARAFYYNADYIDSLNLEQTKFVLAHEALHCALSHFNRRGHRDKRRWDLACDFAINPLLLADGLKPTPDALLLDSFKDMTAEEIYPLIEEDSEHQTQDQHLYDDQSSGGQSDQGSGKPPTSEQQQGDGNQNQGELDTSAGGAPQPPPLSESEREALAIQWQQRLAGAAQQAMQAGKLGGSMARLVDHLLQPQLPWRMLLARYLTATARDDYSFARPSRREGAAILPSLHSMTVDVAIALDTSGSISGDEMNEFASEINAIKGQMNARVTLHACDDKLAPQGPWTYEPWETIRIPETLQGGGGTRFTPIFDWLTRRDRPPDVLVYFTDADGEFPKLEPAFPVIWLVKGKCKVPWGQRVQLN